MRNPARSRNRALGVAAASAGVALFITWQFPHRPFHGALDVTLVLLFSATIFAVIAVPIFQLELQRLSRLRKGKNVIARWLVSASEWSAFLASEPRRNTENGSSVNTVNPGQSALQAGVEIIVGTDSLMVGDDFHSLPRAGLTSIYGPWIVETNPRCLEFRCSASSSNDTISEWTIRFPIASLAQSDVRRIITHYTTRNPEQYKTRDAFNMRRIGVYITLVGIIALITGGAYFTVNGSYIARDAQWANVMLAALILGVLLTPAGLLVAAVWHMRARGR